LCDQLDDADADRIVFFVVASTSFSAAHNISQFFDEFKRTFYQTNSPSQLRKAVKYGGAVHKASQSLLATLTRKYGTSKLSEVQGKVNEVQQVMQKNVYSALQNVEKVETLENKSSELADSANAFQKSSTEVRRMMRCKYLKSIIILWAILIVILIIGLWAGGVFNSDADPPPVDKKD
jgi:hypothetical protein